LVFACIVAIVPAQYSTPAQASAADQCIPAFDVTGSLADEGKTAYKSLYDGEVNTYLNSSANGWQYVQFDFGCQIELYAFRRYMTSILDTRRSSSRKTCTSIDGPVWNST